MAFGMVTLSVFCARRYTWYGGSVFAGKQRQKSLMFSGSSRILSTRPVCILASDVICVQMMSSLCCKKTDGGRPIITGENRGLEAPASRARFPGTESRILFVAGGGHIAGLALFVQVVFWVLAK